MPVSLLTIGKRGLIYADEADAVNLALFGIIVAEWRKQNANLAKAGNIRDHASIEQLTDLVKLENINLMLIVEKIRKSVRFSRLQQEAVRQLNALMQNRRRYIGGGSTGVD